MAAFTALKALVWDASHRNSLDTFNRPRNSEATSARCDVNSLNWFTSPRNERKSVRFTGSGNSRMAKVLDGCIVQPVGLTVYPQKSASY